MGFPPNRKAFHVSGDFIGRDGGPTTPQGGGGGNLNFRAFINETHQPHRIKMGGGTAAPGSYTLYTPTYPDKYPHVHQDLVYSCVALYARTRPPKGPKSETLPKGPRPK